MRYFKPELSEKNEYWLPKHVYYEMIHFCLQYPDWKRLYSVKPSSVREKVKGGVPDPTANTAIRRVEFGRKIELVERCAKEADPELWSYILESVTTGLGFSVLNARNRIPCCKDIFYDRRRKFYWLLAQER